MIAGKKAIVNGAPGGRDAARRLDNSSAQGERVRGTAVATTGFISNSVEPRMIKEGKTRLASAPRCSYMLSGDRSAHPVNLAKKGRTKERRFRQMRSGQQSAGSSVQGRARGWPRTNGNGTGIGRKKERSRRVRVCLLRESSASAKWTGDSSPAARHCSASFSLLPLRSRRAQFIQLLLYFKWTRLFSHFGERSEQPAPHWTAAKAISTREGPPSWRVINAILIPPPSSTRLGVLNRRFASRA